jgi:hypothetical protein
MNLSNLEFLKSLSSFQVLAIDVFPKDEVVNIYYNDEDGKMKTLIFHCPSSEITIF